MTLEHMAQQQMTQQQTTKRDGYKVILADPPWPYRDYAAAAGERHRRARGANKHYPSLSVAELCALPVAEAAADNAALFLWATWPLLAEALTVIDAWGFHYKTLAWVWIKLNKRNAGLFMGMGRYSRANSEPCLLALRGNLPVAAHDVLSVIMAPVREHSRKPEEQYAKIERLYPYGSYLELFARRQSPGWDVFGDEVASSFTFSGHGRCPALLPGAMSPPASLAGSKKEDAG